MGKTKRVLAMIGVCILLLCYVMSFITAITATESSHNWFIASIGATIFIPAVFYAYSILHRVSRQKSEESRRREEAYLRQMKEQLKTAQNRDRVTESSVEHMPNGGENGNTGL